MLPSFAPPPANDTEPLLTGSDLLCFLLSASSSFSQLLHRILVELSSLDLRSGFDSPGLMMMIV
jgi:hypothetical protein